MRFVQEEILKGVGDWEVLHGRLSFVQERTVKCYPDTSVVDLGDYWGVKFYDDFFHVFTNRSFNTLFDYQGNKINEYEKRNFYHFLSQDSYIYYDRTRKQTLMGDQAIFEGKIGSSLRTPNALVFERNHNIYKLDLEHLTTSWMFSLEEMGRFQKEDGTESSYQVKQLLGVYNGLLWVFLNSNEFIALNMADGTKVQHTKSIAKKHMTGSTDAFMDGENEYVFYDTEYILDTEHAEILGLKSDRLFRIELDSDPSTAKVYGLKDSMQAFGLDIHDTDRRSVRRNDKLYFISGLVIGVIDLTVNAIVHVSQRIAVESTEDAWAKLKRVEVDGQKLYVSTSNNNLHIFNIEEDNVT